MTETATDIPRCVGVIMDGNRRWANERGAPTLEGHRAGGDKLKEVVRWAKEAGVQHLIVYAFSTENWKRTEEEVSYLLDLIRLFFSREIQSLKAEGARVRFIGDRSTLPDDIRALMDEVERDTMEQTAIELVVAISYGGRAELVATMAAIVESGVREVTEEVVASHLQTAGTPDPDLIIRTGGKHRLSNFLLWQGAYSELFFTDTLWPDLTRAEFERAIRFFSATKRNFGS